MVRTSKREESAARNELLFRAVNEQIVGMTDRLRAQLSEIDIVCECAKTSCVGAIRIDAGEFGEIKGAAGSFVVLPGHEDETVEQVIRREDHYVVVWKAAVAAGDSAVT